MRPYFTWLEGEKRNTALRLAENVAPVSQPIVEPPSFDLPLSPVQGPDPTANVAADENVEEGVTSRELLFLSLEPLLEHWLRLSGVFMD